MNKIYLVYGTEPYFINDYIKNLQNEYKDYEYVSFNMLDTNISNALECALMDSLFSSNKMIICTNCIFLTGSKCEIEHNINDLLKYIKIDSNNVLLLTLNSDSLDTRKKIVKELEKCNVKVFNKIKDYELIKFVKDYCKNNGYEIDNSTINLFIEKLDNDLYIIISELDKLFLYKDNDLNITREDVELVTSKLINFDVFDLIDSIVKKDIDRSLMIYDDLLVINEEEVKIIITLANQFRLIYQVKEMYKMGYSEYDISKYYAIHPYRVKLAHNVELSSNESLKYLSMLAKLDQMIKTGLIDKKVGFEKFILGM